MPTEVNKQIALEIAHVLFIDIAGYSKLSINEQQAAVDELTRVVRATEQFHKAEANERLIKIATGDGMALVFYRSPEAPVRCAIELSRALKDHPRLRVRMGIHSGPVSGVIDVTGQANLTGAGLNLAHRVMSCGDAGHILLSKHVAEDLEEYEEWRLRLHDLGTCEVKHGARIGITNLYDSELGNPKLPKKVEAIKKHRIRVRCAEVAIALLILGAVVAAFIFVLRKPTRLALAAPEKSIAVLPFENLSEEKGNAYFAEGVQDEILTKLAGIGDLKVISRSSTAKYKSKPEDLKIVGRELGVGAVLEGSVQRAGDKVRVNVQLLDARVDTHLWAKSYDRDLKDVFAVESEVAQEIADALQAKLSPSQSDALAAAPTRDTEAYDLFLKGEYEEHQAESVLSAERFDRAQTLYRQALARDSDFALAYARLAYSELCRHWFISNLPSAELVQVKANVDRALAIAPASPDAHLALALFYYWGYRDYDTALKELDRTLELQPNSANARSFNGYIHRRQGEWKQALVEIERAAELDPRDSLIPTEIGISYLALRRWSDAEHQLARALALDPHNANAAQALARTYINSTGDVRRGRQAFEGVPVESEFGAPTNPGTIANVVGQRVYLDVLEKHFADALKALSVASSETSDARLRQLEARAGIQVLAGQDVVAEPDCEQTRALLEARLAERRADRMASAALAWVYLCLGRNDDALRVAQDTANSLTIEKDALAGPALLAGLAEIEARTGQPENAVKILRQLLTIPAGAFVSIARLKIDPVWDPIRSDPDFQKLVSEPEPETIYK